MEKEMTMTPTIEELGLPWRYAPKDENFTAQIVSTKNAPDECVLCAPIGQEHIPDQAEMDFLVTACNNHHALVAALKPMLLWAVLWSARAVIDNPHGAKNAMKDLKSAMAALKSAGTDHGLREDGIAESEASIDAALALAEPKKDDPPTNA